MSKGYAKRYFASLGQFYAATPVPVRPFMHWPQWARDAYLDAISAHRWGKLTRRFTNNTGGVE